MTYDKFENYINIIYRLYEKEERLHKGLEEIVDGNFITIIADEMSSAYVELLELYFDCGDTISWYIWECDDKSDACFWEDGVEVPMRSIRDLYDYCMKCKNKEKE